MAELRRDQREGLSTNEFYRQQLLLGLRDYARRCGFSAAVVGCSSSIDSALTLAIAVGRHSARRMSWPSPCLRSTRAAAASQIQQLLCQNLGIPLYTHPIGNLVEQYVSQFSTTFGEPLVGLSKEKICKRVSAARS